MSTGNVLADSTPAQLFGAVVVAGAACIALNDGMDMWYRALNARSLADGMALVDDLLRAAAAVYVLMSSVGTPFDAPGTARGAVLYCTSLLAAATSDLLADPQLLFAEFKTFTLATISLDASIVELVGEEGELAALSATAATRFGEYYVYAFYLSKWALAVAAAAHLVARQIPLAALGARRIWHRGLRRELAGRLLLLGAVGLNGWAAFEHLVRPTVLSSEAQLRAHQISSLGIRETLVDAAGVTNATQAKEILSRLGEDLISPAFMRVADEQLRWATVAVLVLLAGAVAAVHPVRAAALPPLVLLSAYNLVALEASTSQEELYAALLVVGAVAALLAAASSLRAVALDALVRGLPALLYRAGLLAMLLAVPLLFMGYSHPWVDFTVRPVFSVDIAVIQLNTAVARIDSMVDSVAQAVVKINPCIQAFAVDPDKSQSTPDTDRDVDANMAAQRREMVKQCMIDCNECLNIEGGWYVDGASTWWRQDKCEEMVQRERDQNADIKDEVSSDTEEAAKGKNLAFVTNTTVYEVNEHCEGKKCAVFTALAAALLVLAKVPFFGTVAVVVKEIMTIAFKFVRFALRMFKKLRRFYNRNKKLQKIRKRMRDLRVNAVRSVLSPSVSKSLLWIMLPVLVSGAVALTLIMLRRRTMREPPLAPRLLLALRVGVGLALPLAAAEVISWVVLTYYPVIVGNLLAVLPADFVEYDFSVNVGLRATKAAYLLSAAGNASLFLSAVLYAFGGTLQALVGLAARAGAALSGRPLPIRMSAARAADPLRGTLRAACTFGDVRRALAAPPRALSTAARRRRVSWAVRAREIAASLLDWEARYLQPLLFSAVAVPVLYYNSAESEYIVFKYRTKQDLAETAGELADLNRAVIDAVDTDDEFEELNCGPIAKIAEVALAAMLNLRAVFIAPYRVVMEKLADALSGLEEALERLVELADSVAVAAIPDAATLHNLLFAVPVGITLAFGLAWVLSVVGGDISSVPVLRRFLGSGDLSLDEAMAPVASAATILSISMILTHVTISAMLETISESDFGFFQFEVSIGQKYYGVMGAHIANLITIASYYVNLQVPVASAGDAQVANPNPRRK
ncbi:Hypothetical Protein FCC1311_085992 [Hondaea fermentalgiana]|uniref:Uncharacterized protein n=1 Tax=Hondaea fermentalgiana TaxID=2315210 RepID=A0A2R5GWR3_9STRA|nr:Hypothetical Protein FCC1311_085992 [Hondaea fermentalgiana]|eukprot:GBG32374.1 Hypothetical Protein FCC1311_085992 [Hondaea fermentalgiana]